MAHGVRFTFLFYLCCSLVGVGEGLGSLDRSRERRYGKSSKSKSSSHSSGHPGYNPYFSFYAMGTQEQEIPVPIETTTTAKAYLWFDAGFTSLKYRIDVFNGSGITKLHFHCGVAGMSGPLVVEVFNNADGVDSDDTLKEGYIDNGDIKDGDFSVNPACEIEINNIASIYEAAVQRRLYLNVHSVLNEEGEVRGQVVKY